VWPTVFRSAAAGENLKLFKTEAEQAGGQRLGDRSGATVFVDLEVVEIVPVIDDEEIGFLLAALTGSVQVRVPRPSICQNFTLLKTGLAKTRLRRRARRCRCRACPRKWRHGGNPCS
jgi:hypothetical protein